MEVSIVHSGVRVRPDLVVEIQALADGKPINVALERDTIRRLLGPEVNDPGTLFISLQRKLETIRLAIEAFVFARGTPLDQHVWLSWRDVSPFVEDGAVPDVVAR